MKINEKNLYSFANTTPVDKNGYLLFKRDVKFSKRWFVLKGNLLFYFEKKGDKEPLGLLLLEGCTVELSADEDSQQYCFQIQFITPGEVRSYYLAADSQTTMESWMKAISCASYEYVKLMVAELQRQLEEIDNRNKNQALRNDPNLPIKPPRQRQERQNPFNKIPTSSTSYNTSTTAEITKLTTTTTTTTTALESIEDNEASPNQEIGKVLQDKNSNTDNKITVT